MFQYLGSRGAQRTIAELFRNIARFNTWAREEPNRITVTHLSPPPCFNTWAREEPNFFSRARRLSITGFNTWAREEPNVNVLEIGKMTKDVSILGLARSPTYILQSPHHNI